jgi:threonine/homoserine/homoserine lactone efflux protein
MLVLSLVLIGLAITLEPIPLTAFILILASKGGVRKGAGFIFGWLVSLAIVIAFTVLVTGNNPPKPNTAPSLASLAAKLAIGAGLLVIAIRYYRKRRAASKPAEPGSRTCRPGAGGHGLLVITGAATHIIRPVHGRRATAQ